MKWFVKCIKNYVNFSGRARRSEYWYFILVSLIIMLALRAVDIMSFGVERIGLFSMIFGLFIFLPQAAVMVRRLHDTGRSGMWVLWYYVLGIIWAVLMSVIAAPAIQTAVQQGTEVKLSVPVLLFVGIGALVFLVWAVVFLVWFCIGGDKGENKYGPAPKAE